MKSDTPQTDRIFEKFKGIALPRPHHCESTAQANLRFSVEELERQRNLADDALKYAAIEIAELRHQIRETIRENLHLADGDNCTLKLLKDAISFELEDSCENSIRSGSEISTVDIQKRDSS
jgi:hypothetical protein